VPLAVPTTAGIPCSRAMIAGCGRIPPLSATIAPILGKTTGGVFNAVDARAHVQVVLARVGLEAVFCELRYEGSDRFSKGADVAIRDGCADEHREGRFAHREDLRPIIGGETVEVAFVDDALAVEDHEGDRIGLLQDRVERSTIPDSGDGANWVGGRRHCGPRSSIFNV
jgi:hypothetical protein